jgi:hypothetical protein
VSFGVSGAATELLGDRSLIFPINSASKEAAVQRKGRIAAALLTPRGQRSHRLSS